jgi:hypothetical protein
MRWWKWGKRSESQWEGRCEEGRIEDCMARWEASDRKMGVLIEPESNRKGDCRLYIHAGPGSLISSR